MAWLRLFDFDVVHVPGEKNGAADALSRRPKCDGDSEDEEETEDDIEQMIESDIYAVWGRAVKVLAGRAAHENEPSSELPWERLIEYLSTVRRPDGLTSQEFRKLKSAATKFIFHEKKLYRRKRASEPPTRVIFEREERNEILKALHDEGSHRGREATFQCA